MTVRIFGVHVPPRPGDLLWMVDYEGNCDNCGAHHHWPDSTPVVFVGSYQDKRGMAYDMFEVCFWKPCGCGGIIGTITLFMGGFPANAFGLFAKAAI